MGYNDLREWIDVVNQKNELLKIEGANPDLEISAIAEISRREGKLKPALLFDKITGYPEGYRVLVSSLNSINRLALTTRLPQVNTWMEFVQIWREKIKHMELIPPQKVKDGPIMENVYEEKDINMLKFPAPKWHTHDGGRYIGTGSVTIMRDPESGWINVGTFRVMIHDEKTLGFYMTQGKHGSIIRNKWFERNEPCPVAISFGHDPLVFLVGATHFHSNDNEFSYVGGIRGEGIDTIDGELTGLPIPASSEIAIEGFAYPGEVMEEGPFGEFPGYYGSAQRPEAIIRVKRLMHRNNPIILGSPPSRPPGDATVAMAPLRSAMIWNELEAAGISDIKGVWTHVAGAVHYFTVVSIKQRYPGHAKQAALVTAGCHGGAYMGRYVVVVDEDIDPADLDAVIWAMSTRSEPVESIDIIRRAWSGPLDPRIQAQNKGLNSRALIDATRPFEWKNEFPLVAEIDSKYKNIVKDKWKDLINCL